MANGIVNTSTKYSVKTEDWYKLKAYIIMLTIIVHPKKTNFFENKDTKANKDTVQKKIRLFQEKFNSMRTKPKLCTRTKIERMIIRILE